MSNSLFGFVGNYVQPTVVSINIGTTAITSGVVGRVLFEGVGNVVQESANLFWDNVNGRLGIGTSTPTDGLDITQMGYGFISLNRTGVASAAFLITNIRTGGGQGLVIDTGSFSFRNGTSKNLILDGGRIGVNTNDDSLNASFTVKGAGATSTTKNILFKNSLNTDLFTIWDDGAVGVNTSINAGFKVDINGTARINTLTIGLGAGQVVTNTAFGFTALNANTTGTANTVVGYTALLSNTTGAGNTAIGFNSLNGTNGINNSGCGNSTFRHLTSGNLNTAVGAEAGRYIADGSTFLTICDNSVFLGMLSKASANSQTNQIVIGHNAIGSGSNTATLGNTSIVRTLLNGNVLINTTTDAGFKLDVNGTARVSGDLTITTGSLIRFNNSNIYISQFMGGNNGIEIRAAASGTDAVKVTSSSFIINFSGAYTYEASAILQAESTTKGFLPPRMTSTQRNAIASPATGLMVYDTTMNLISVYNGTIWITL